MSGTWGNNLKLTVFGESHGKAVGGVIDGLKAGFCIDFSKIDFEMQRRNHRAFYSTNRDEKDEYEILSGVKDGAITGSPLSFIIRNEDTISSDYINLNQTPRPGHADYPAYVKFKGFNDYRGGGHFSGRLTAPLTFAGAIAKQLLFEDNIRVFSHIYSIGSVKSESILEKHLNNEEINNLNSFFPVLNKNIYKKMECEIEKYKEDGNSIGGIVECAVYGIKAGVGSPFFASVESEISKMMFSIPAIKGIEFGRGFSITEMSGFYANDAYEIKDGSVTASTNNNGGILGGITNGMPIVFRVAVKPTPSVFKTQNTVNLKTLENTQIELKGRHDCCIVPRAAAVIEAAAALVIADMLGKGQV